MSKTPTKTSDSSAYSSLKELLTPNKDPTGLVRTVFTQVSGIHSLLNKWFTVIDKGTVIVRSISALKLHECSDDYYPYQLKRLMEDLLEAKNALKEILENVDVLTKQLQVLPQLHKTGLPVMNTWLAPHFSSQVSFIFISLCRELKLKEIITENIAHCRDEKLIEVYASAWEYTMYIHLDSVSYMFAEIGLNAIKKDINI